MGTVLENQPEEQSMRKSSKTYKESPPCLIVQLSDNKPGTLHPAVTPCSFWV